MGEEGGGAAGTGEEIPLQPIMKAKTLKTMVYRSLLHSGSFGHPPDLTYGPPWAAGGQPASPWAARESLFWHLKHLLPLLLH